MDVGAEGDAIVVNKAGMDKENKVLQENLRGGRICMMRRMGKF